MQGGESAACGVGSFICKCGVMCDHCGNMSLLVHGIIGCWQIIEWGNTNNQIVRCQLLVNSAVCFICLLYPLSCMNADDAIAVVERLGHTSRMLNREEYREVCAVHHALERLLEVCRKAVVRHSHKYGGPCIMPHMIDGCGAGIAGYNVNAMGEHSFSRSGRSPGEFLAQKSLLRVKDLAGETHVAIRLAPAIHMTGKTGWYNFGASLSESVRSSAPASINNTMYCQGGLHYQSMLRRQAARHECMYELQSLEDGHWKSCCCSRKIVLVASDECFAKPRRPSSGA